MKKYLFTIKFRYYAKPINEDDDRNYRNKTVTIGVYDTIEESIIEGNKCLEQFEKRFKLHKYPDGYNASKKRFSKNGGCFGSFHNLITHLGYLKTPFEFYAKIDTLHYEDLGQTIESVLSDLK